MNELRSGFALADTYRFFVDYATEHGGNTPSYNTIATACGFSKPTAYSCVKRLIKEGYLERKGSEIMVAGARLVVPTRTFGETQSATEDDLLAMTIIPKDITIPGQRTLDSFGIATGNAFDEEFLRASYPPGWRYERWEMPRQVSATYLLLDCDTIPRATVGVNWKGNPAASIRFFP